MLKHPPSRAILLSPGRTGSQALVRILTQLAPCPGIKVRHEHPLSRTLIPIAHLNPSWSEQLALRITAADHQSVQAQTSGSGCSPLLKHIRIDPLLSHCAARAWASQADRLVFLTRHPVDWVESLARKIRYQKLYPLIRALPWLRPTASASLRNTLEAELPRESPYLLGLLAAYVALHRVVAAFPEQPLQLRYEHLYGVWESPTWRESWQALWSALGWNHPFPSDQVQLLQQRRRNAAPIRLGYCIHNRHAVERTVMALIAAGC